MAPSIEKKLHRSKKMAGTSNSSHVISEFNAASCGTAAEMQTNNMITPTIRIVHIFPPKVIKTDPANFRALVQELTGRHSRRSSKKPKKKLRSPAVNPPHRPESRSRHSMALTGDHHFCSKQTWKSECPCYQNPVAEIKSESFEGNGMNLCDNFAGFFGGFAELDIFATLMDSGSTLPEIPTISSQAAQLMPLESGGFSHFY